ncbi:MAG: sigma-70 family RNA polymerase sigma factor [Gaiellales bacterium]
MAARLPLFESFYETHRAEVLAFLRKRAGADRADDLFQETFLRALRAYDRLEHGDHLRAWVLTIASRVLIDAFRRAGVADSELPELTAPEPETPLESLAPLVDGLPPKEKAAVTLRYGFDLDYDQIARVLGSSEDAARQATSSGVRRLRRERSAQ